MNCWGIDKMEFTSTVSLQTFTQESLWLLVYWGSCSEYYTKYYLDCIYDHNNVMLKLRLQLTISFIINLSVDCFFFQVIYSVFKVLEKVQNTEICNLK